MSEKRAILDLTGCQYLFELHERIKNALKFPDYYGKNWDAFWDCISCDCDVTHLTIVGEQSVSPILKSQITMLNDLLEKHKQECAKYGWDFEYEIEE